jgi:hypothetical protein
MMGIMGRGTDPDTKVGFLRHLAGNAAIRLAAVWEAVAAPSLTLARARGTLAHASTFR